MAATLSTKTRSRGRRTGGTYRPMAEINMTPFIDVMLVLLIVFMVAAPLLTTGVQVDLPDASAKAITDENNKPIELTINKEGKIFIGDTEFKEDRIVPQLKAMSEERTEQPRIYIRGDKTLEYGKVMRMIGAINGAGFTKVALISEQKTR
ncbi:MAG: protein TolR [Alphaproteobacteria bacterium]|nr:protein TolR [Alphaproteobacteria bacterium]